MALFNFRRDVATPSDVTPEVEAFLAAIDNNDDVQQVFVGLAS